MVLDELLRRALRLLSATSTVTGTRSVWEAEAEAHQQPED